jgi:hypothetical protein
VRIHVVQVPDSLVRIHLLVRFFAALPRDDITKANLDSMRVELDSSSDVWQSYTNGACCRPCSVRHGVVQSYLLSTCIVSCLTAAPFSSGSASLPASIPCSMTLNFLSAACTAST